ncbi:unnamed protein product [Brachionus calyciflorus]|uniref:Oxysterol-binding protein n=1 Tax=Brachionus calyciflorus TaxID=104777 RepID=A0A813N3V6_9BILA|nr:unnamed protein product [Brachionus calyciflorus]
MGEFNLNTCNQEGSLYKYTNVVKGFQIRYFVVDSKAAKLNYFMSQDAKSQKPRGSIELLNSIISPSEEDSTTFTINTPENEIFKLRAQDAKERQHWVNVLRLVSQSKSEKEFKIYLNDKSDSNLINLTPKKETLDEQSQSSSSEKLQSNCDLIREIFDLIKSSYQEFEKSIDNLPQKDAPICRYDQNLLIFKATASSCVNNLVNCCNNLSIREENKSFLNDSDLIDSLSNSQRLNFNNKSLLDVTYRQISGEVKLEHHNTSPRKSIVNPDDELTEDENELTKSKDQIDPDRKKHDILKFFSNLTEGFDLTKKSMPISLFEKKSLLEMYADILSYPDYLIKTADERTPEDRFISVVQWFLGSFHLIKKQFANRKKPFNPILGEVFNCSWKVNDETSTNILSYTAEQVSHHPPISAFYLECKQKKLKLNSNILTKSTYSGTSVAIQLLGEMILKLEKNNEEYHITFPKLYSRSIITDPWVELGDSCSIKCSQTGIKAVIEFEVKSFYGEKINQVFAEIKTKNEDILCRIKGEWDGKLEYIFGSESSKVIKTVDFSGIKPGLKRIRPIHLQEENESRRVWDDVCDSLNNFDFESAQNYKHIIEKQQKLTEKLRKDKNLAYLSKNFFKSKTLHENQSSSLLNSHSKSSNLNDLVNFDGNDLPVRWWHKNWPS